jgi:hypothetical protein
MNDARQTVQSSGMLECSRYVLASAELSLVFTVQLALRPRVMPALTQTFACAIPRCVSEFEDLAIMQTYPSGGTLKTNELGVCQTTRGEGTDVPKYTKGSRERY